MRKPAVIAFIALGLGFLAGRLLAPSKAAPGPPPAEVHPPPAPGPPADAESLRSRLADAEASVALLRREIADQDRRRQGLEAQLASVPAAGTGKAYSATHDWDREEPVPEWKQFLQKRLRETVHYKFEDVRFEDAKEYLDEQGGVWINVDKLALTDNDALNKTRVQLASPDEGMSLESALNYLTKAVGLAWTLRGETIMITTEAGLRESPRLETCDVRDLLAKVQGAMKTNPGIVTGPTTDAALAEYLKTYVDAAEWKNPDCAFQTVGGVLHVTAPPATQQRIREALKTMWERYR